ncbi:MAG: hypothetical protein VR68_16400 [Peptococcaceae bacterium BRH_c4a]|nr:MAG: hypothetical protein VR68_16400 [Peptococcaceae bacterium BRH_c4a]
MQTAESRSQESGARIVTGTALNMTHTFLNDKKRAANGSFFDPFLTDALGSRLLHFAGLCRE